MSEELQNEFFSKKTIAGLNKLMLQQSNYQNLNRDGKEKLINILIKNMKVVYRSLDSTKINKDNFTSIFDQFKKHAVNESLEEIKKSNVLMNLQQSSSDLKFERDFKSNPNPGNKFLDRPESTKSITPQVNITKKPNENLSGVSANKSKFDSSLDQAFKPMVENLTDQNFFNNYDTGRNTKDINAMMDNIQQMRQTELNIKNQKPPTPEFLKSKKTNPDKMELRNDVQSMSQSNGKLDFQNMKSSDFNRGFQGLAIDSGDNLMSLDNIDKPLIDQEITEDTHSFEDRLTRLQSDRDNLKVPQTNDKIDFTSENFPQSNMNSNNVIQEQNRVRFNDSNVQTPVKRNDFDIEAKRNEMIREAELKKRRDIELRKEAEMRAQYKQQTTIETNDRFNDLKNSMKMVNIEVKEDVVKMNQLKQHIEDLKNEIDELKQENIILQQNNDYEKIIEIKKQIANEFEVLSQKNSELDTKTAEINLKDIEINKKDSELKQLIKNYDYLFRTNQLQIEVINPNNESKYTFPLDKVNDAISIKLMSYSIPYPLFNIEENKNNELKLLYKNDEIILTIPNGKYNIEDLIEILNIELTNKNLNEIEIKLNKQQKIIIEITNDEEEISIIPTLLSTENLGFTSSSENKKIHIADKIWDLRMIDKVYLFLNNLSDEVPFGILHFNGKSICQFKFEKPFNIDKLEIEFKDSKGLPINFYNLSHNLSFMIEKIS
jgi:predicted metalloenzyme YecM